MENENILERSLEIASIRRYRVRIYENEILYQELQLSLMEITAKLLTHTYKLNRIDIRLKNNDNIIASDTDSVILEKRE